MGSRHVVSVRLHRELVLRGALQFAGGAFTLMPYSRLKRLIDMVHSHGSYVSTGGFIERVISSSGGDTRVIGKYLEECKEAGYDMTNSSYMLLRTC